MRKISKIVTTMIFAMIAVTGVVYAGSLTPPSSTVTSQGYTLSDIYNKIISGSSATAHNLYPSVSNPSATFKTLTDIWNAIPATLVISPDSTEVPVGINRLATTLNSIDTDLIASNIKNGVSIFGVNGTYTGSTGGTPTLTWTGTFPAYSQSGGWQTGFGPNHAGLCWSHGTFEINSGFCSTLQVEGPPTYRAGGFYDASLAHDNSLVLGAVEYCDYLTSNGTTLSTTPQHYWRLPTQDELYTEMSKALFSGVYDPATGTRGGFRNGNYLSSIFNETNYYLNTPAGTFDTIKTVEFRYSNDRKWASPFTAARDTQVPFRCVHP